jgi:PAS domain S-box-containing protein
MDNCPAMIYIKDSDGRIIFVNRWLATMPGFKGKQIVGLTDHDIMPKDVADRLRENDILTLESGSPQTFEEVIRQPDGTELTHLSIKFPLPSMPGAVCGISTDITERKRMEDELVRARKLESIGTLAGGIAHDFNNVLLGVLGNASIAKAYLHSDHKAWSLLDDIERAAERAKRVTRQLLTFSRGDVMIKEVVETGPLVYSTSKLLLGEHDIELDADLPEDLWSVEVDETMIGQVMEHIMLNAAHSMPDGGTVELRGSNVTVAEGAVPPLEPGKYAKIDIVDHGLGIQEESLPLLFDPFFRGGGTE